MIQATQDETLSRSQTINLNLWDSDWFRSVYTINPHIPLVNIISQQTGNNKVFAPFAIDLTNKDRYISLTYITNPSNEDLTLGLLEFGNDDFPFGFYNMQIFARGSDSMSIIALNAVYTGLFNITNDVLAVNYSQYSTNDTDTNSIYITN